MREMVPVVLVLVTWLIVWAVSHIAPTDSDACRQTAGCVQCVEAGEVLECRP